MWFMMTKSVEMLNKVLIPSGRVSDGVVGYVPQDVTIVTLLSDSVNTPFMHKVKLGYAGQSVFKDLSEVNGYIEQYKKRNVHYVNITHPENLQELLIQELDFGSKYYTYGYTKIKNDKGHAEKKTANPRKTSTMHLKILKE